MPNDCGCPEDKLDVRLKHFQYDNTGYNVESVLKMTESQFVDHRMHIGHGKYAHLPVEDRIALFKRIHAAILKYAGKEVEPIATPPAEEKPIEQTEQ